MKYIITPFTRIFDITGKSSRKEFWTFQLFLFFIVYPVIGFIGTLLDSRMFKSIVMLIFAIPAITQGMRRLNDANILKWLFLIPFLNWILAAMPPKPEKKHETV